MRDKPVQVGSEFHWPLILAWVCCVIFYFLQYVLRSAPGVMIPELTSSFGLSALGVSSLIGLYYYTYSTFAILSGACFDRYGARYVVTAGIGLLAIGAALFGLLVASVLGEAK
jgi:fucose permease